MALDSLPYSLDIISEYLESFQPPEGPFDPDGDWDHRYVMWVALRGPAGKSWPAGALRIKRTGGKAGTVRLDIDQITKFSGVRREHVRLDMTVQQDRLSTPLKWLGRAWIPDRPANDRGISYLTGEVLSEGNIDLGRGVAYASTSSNPISTNWSLFDAVQRMPFYSGPFKFDMLEDVQVFKLNQRIAYRKPVEIVLSGKTVRLHSFEQTGYGILPYTYWLDDQHRLLFAVGGLRTFLWDPNVSIPEDKL